MPKSLKSIFDKLKEIYEGISVTLKLIFSIALILSIIAGFTFVITYMRGNRFFSYEIFNVSNIWIFLLAGIYAVIILICAYGFFILGACMRITQSNPNVDRCLLYKWHDSGSLYIFINIFLVIVVFFIGCYFGHNDNSFTTFFAILAIIFYVMYMSSVLKDCKDIKILFMVSAIICTLLFGYFCYRRLNISFVELSLSFTGLGVGIFLIVCQAISIKRLFIAISMVVFLILLISMLIFPIIWVDIYKEFFKSIDLASDHVEIYLKDKNGSVPGKLIFDDGKYAYVEFNRTDRNCGDVGDSCIKTIRKKVPSEDVSIITRVKKDTKASVPK